MMDIIIKELVESEILTTEMAVNTWYVQKGAFMIKCQNCK